MGGCGSQEARAISWCARTIGGGTTGLFCSPTVANSGAAVNTHEAIAMPAQMARFTGGGGGI